LKIYEKKCSILPAVVIPMPSISTRTGTSGKEEFSMRRPLSLLSVAALILVFAAGPARCQEEKEPAWNPRSLDPIDVNALKIGKERTIATFDTQKTRGFLPVIVAWSPNDSYLFIVAQKIDRNWKSDFLLGTEYWTEEPGPLRSFFTVTVSGEKTDKVEKAPAWLQQYWYYKSSDVSLGGEKITREVAKHGAGTVYRLSNIVVGRPWQFKGGIEEGTAWSASTFLYPGFTYSWSPPGGEALVFNDEYKLYIMSADGKTKRKIGSGDFVLPAWSNLGNRIAFVSIGLGRTWTVHLIEFSGIEYKKR
jgi:hypothetical protein